MSSISYTRYYFPSISWPANTKATETQYIALLHTDGSYATLTICKEKWQNIREASVPNRDTGKPNSPLWPCGILCIFSKFCKFSSKEIRYFATFRSGHKNCTMSFYHVHRRSWMVGSASIQTGINYQIQLACKFWLFGFWCLGYCWCLSIPTVLEADSQLVFLSIQSWAGW